MRTFHQCVCCVIEYNIVIETVNLDGGNIGMQIRDVREIRFCAKMGASDCNKIENGECIMDIGHDTKHTEKCYSLYEKINHNGWKDDISAGLFRHSNCGGRYSSGFQHRLCVMKKMEMSSFVGHVALEETDVPCWFCPGENFRKMASKSKSDFLIYEKSKKLKDYCWPLSCLAQLCKKVISGLDFFNIVFSKGYNSGYETTFLELKNK